MRNLVRCGIIWIAFFICLTGTAFADPDCETIPVGDLKVLSILDAEGSMEASLLPQLNRYPELAGLFKNGPLPSVSKTYFLTIGDHRILIDAGWGDGQQTKGQTLSILKREGITPDSVTDIIMTHLDFDHIGGLLAKDAATYPNATLWISRPEYDAWIKAEMHRRPAFAKELVRKVAGIYKDRIKLFDFGQELLPGIAAIDASGHTPGHTAYEISSGDKKLLIIGDAIHISQVQFMKPALSTVYDVYPEQAAKTRQRLLEKAANEGSEVGGMHFDMVSPVRKKDDGGFMIRQPR